MIVPCPHQDGVAMLWDLAEGKRLYSLDAGDIIHALCFSPNRYWLCAATQSCIKVSYLATRPSYPFPVPMAVRLSNLLSGLNWRVMFSLCFQALSPYTLTAPSMFMHQMQGT